MNYPLLSEYCSAVKEAADNFDQLQHLRPVLDAQGEPIMSSGNFAVVFKMHDAQAGKDVAVKCFLKEQEGREASYRLISQELSFVSNNFLTPIRYLEKELFVASNSTKDEEFPVVLMDWIEGVTLDCYVVSHLNDFYALQTLAFQFSRLASWLMSQPFAHGDLKPDNILVRTDGSLVLVDYDGMYVPAMQGQKARELGSPDFRHPQRTPECFDEHIDDFAITVILLSLKALSICPSLWNDYATSDRLLFSAADYRDLSACALLKDLSELFTDAELVRVYGLFLLAHAGGDLTAVSFRLLNLSFPEKPQVEATMELSTEVTNEDKENGFFDEFGVLYSKDGLKLLEGNSDLTEYTVREGTRVICNCAFYDCYSLVSLALPASLKSIGDSAFMECCSLKSQIFPSSLQSIKDYAYAGCSSLTNLIMPAGLKSIGNFAFSASSLASLTLPEGLTTIGDFAFSHCSCLVSLTLPTSLMCIGTNPFNFSKNLILYNYSKHFKIIDGMLLCLDDSRLITYFGKGSEVTIPNFVKRIGKNAFHGCSSLTNLNLPDGLTAIGDFAFVGCSSLTSLNLPDGLTAIGERTFLGCSSLTSLNLPDGLITIGESAFQSCSSLTSLNLPNRLTAIGDFAFLGCSSLTSLNLPDGLITIGKSAFFECFSLSALYISHGYEFYFKQLLPAEYHSKLLILPIPHLD